MEKVSLHFGIRVTPSFPDANPRCRVKVKSISSGPHAMLAASEDGVVYFCNFTENVSYLVSEFSGCFVHKVVSPP